MIIAIYQTVFFIFTELILINLDVRNNLTEKIDFFYLFILIFILIFKNLY